MKSVAIVTADRYLYQKLKLELSASGGFFVHSDPSSCDVCFLDTDTAECHESVGRIIRISRDWATGCVHLPLPIGAAARLAGEGADGALISLLFSERCAVLRGEKIRLTEIEFALFSQLYALKGNFCSRDELMRRVWKGEAEGGVLNVYIHYLREKLEKSGEKIILSSRKSGYAIDKKYFGGAECSE